LPLWKMMSAASSGGAGVSTVGISVGRVAVGLAVAGGGLPQAETPTRKIRDRLPARLKSFFMTSPFDRSTDGQHDSQRMLAVHGTKRKNYHFEWTFHFPVWIHYIIFGGASQIPPRGEWVRRARGEELAPYPCRDLRLTTLSRPPPSGRTDGKELRRMDGGEI
jgi:hypothetical protein